MRLSGLIVLAAALPGCRRAEPATLRLGYFANVTHAPAIVMLDRGFLAEELGPGITLQTRTFNAGPEAVEAIFSNALDITYVGPNPAINAYARSRGEAIRIIAGAASGGAALVVQPSITAPAQLRGATLASPQLGNTQDVALRAWLASQHLATTREGGGDVHIMPQANAQTLETFRAGRIQGAWVPEPWASRLVIEGGGHVLVDERALWPDSQFVTTQVVVRTAFLREHPDAVARFLRAHVRAIAFLNDDPVAARALVNAAIGRLTGKALSDTVIARAWSALRFTVDPIAASLRKSARDAAGAGLLDTVNLDGIYDLGALNQILARAGQPPITP